MLQLAYNRCMADNELLSITEAAALLGVSRQSVYRYVRAGKLRAVVRGHRILVDRAGLSAFDHEYIPGESLRPEPPTKPTRRK